MFKLALGRKRWITRRIIQTSGYAYLPSEGVVFSDGPGIKLCNKCPVFRETCCNAWDIGREWERGEFFRGPTRTFGAGARHLRVVLAPDPVVLFEQLRA